MILRASKVEFNFILLLVRCFTVVPGLKATVAALLHKKENVICTGYCEAQRKLKHLSYDSPDLPVGKQVKRVKTEP